MSMKGNSQFTSLLVQASCLNTLCILKFGAWCLIRTTEQTKNGMNAPC